MASGQKPFYIALGIVIVGGIAFIVSRKSAGSISIPANVVVTTADTSGFRGYILGSPSAPVEITEYADFECPHCADFDEVQFPDVKARLIDTGKARLRYRDFPIDGLHKQSRVASHVAACANDQGKFWQVKDGLFRRQTDWAFKDSPMGIFTEIVKDAGVDVASWKTCMESKKYAGRIQASLNEGNAAGISGTPSFIIGGRIYTEKSSDLLAHVVDSLIATMPKPAPGTTIPTGGK